MKKLAVCTAFLLAGVPFARTIVPQAPNLFGDCYRITTAEELYGFAEIVNKGETNACGILMNDVVVNADSIDTDYAEWTPIGTKENPFKGSFKGEHNTIRGLYSKNLQSEAMGFLGYITEDSTALTYVYNLGLEDVHFEGSGSIGAFVGIINSNNKVYFDDVYATGIIKGTDGSVVGGFAGTINGKARISEAYNTVTVSGSSASSFIGKGDSRNAGISVENNLHFTNCYALSDYAMVGGDNVNGISTYESKQFQDGTVAVKLNRADDPRSDYPTYWTQEKGVDHPKFYSRKEKLTYSPLIYHMPDGTTQTSYYRVVSDLIKLDSINDNNFCFMGWYKSPDFSGNPETEIPKYSYGTQEFWSLSMPKDKDGWCLIENADDLYHFATGINSKHSKILGRDTVFKGKLTADIVVNKNVLDKDGNLNPGDFKQWTPIGENPLNPFKGDFDGNGHTISGLYSTGKETNSFFNWLNRIEGDSVSQTIKNLGIVDSYFGEGDAYGLFYSARGNITIDNCFFEGTLVTATDIGDAAGLFNYYSDTTASIIISNSHSKAKIEANYAAGLARGLQAREAIVRNSYFEGSISTAHSAGGLFFYSKSVTLENCYSTALLNGKDIGALVYNAYGKITIINSYAVFPYFETASYLNRDFTDISLVGNAMDNLEIINSYVLIDEEHDKGIPYKGLVAYPKEKFEDGTVAALLHEYYANGVDGSIWGQESGAKFPNFSSKVNSTKVPYATLALKTYDGDPNARNYPTQYVIGHKLILPTATEVKRDNYYFAGWYKTSDFSGNIITELDSTEKKNVTLYAKFVPTVSITLVDEFAEKETLIAGKGIERKLPPRSRKGFIFGGWYKQKDYSSSTLGSITTSNDITLYARWIEIKIPQIKDGCYQITDAGELYGLDKIEERDMCAELTNDIVLNRDVLDKNGNLNESSKDCFAEWIPIIGVSYKSFNGNGHTINGLFFNTENTREAGLFGWFKSKATNGFTISNLGIKDAYIRGKSVVGGIIGRSYSSTKIINSFYEGVLISRQNTAGGLVGIADDSISIVNSYHLGPVYEEIDNSALGAFIGMLYYQGRANPEMVSITNSYHAGELKARIMRSFQKAIGLVGYALTNNKVQDLIVTHNVFAEGDVPTIDESYTSGLYNVASKKFASGYVATKLHNYNSNGVEGSIWGQTSGRLYPDFSGIVDESFKDSTDSVTTRYNYFVQSDYPTFNLNVAGKQIQINSSVTGAPYAIFDMQGSVVLQGNLEATNIKLYVPRSGTYIVRIGKTTRQVNVK